MKTVFRSTSANLRVSFPPEQFGMGKDVENKDAPFSSAKFDFGAFETASVNLIKMMRQHVGNESNGGSSFWEEKSNDTRAIAFAGKAKAFKPEEGFSEADHELIKCIHTLSDNLPKNKVEFIKEKISEAISRFQIIGIQKDMDSLKSYARVKARAIEITGLFEDEGWIAPKE